MKPGYWIGILAVAGGVVGYLVFRTTGWLGSGLGIVLGALAGTIIYAMQTRRKK